jgi:hypothetical protein
MERYSDKVLKLINVHPNGMANFYGLRNDDILCVSGSDGELMIESVEAVKVGLSRRPLTIEVRRGHFPEV